jgi:hypothetical protein
MAFDCATTRRAVLLAGAALLLSSEVGAAARKTRNLFTIARSTNKNVVHYDVVLQRGDQLNLSEPLVAYWVMHAEDGRREPLTWLERQLAYGFRIASEVRSEGFRLRLDAFPQRELTVARTAAGLFRAHVAIAGERAILERIFVATDEGGITPSVRYVDVEGVSASGRRVSERIKR